MTGLDEVFEIPVLFCPIEPVQHPLVDEMERGFITWMDDLGLAADERTPHCRNDPLRQLIRLTDPLRQCGPGGREPNGPFGSDERAVRPSGTPAGASPPLRPSWALLAWSVSLRAGVLGPVLGIGRCSLP